MIFSETSLAGSFMIEAERINDNRGFFARTWCMREFAAHGLDHRFVQCNISYNVRRGTLRGLHFQGDPHAEAKLVRCTAGSIYDVIVDIRSDSPSRYCWFAAELTAEKRNMLYIPSGFAHGFQTLEDHTEVFYQMTEFFHVESAAGIRWNDPCLNIEWPLEITMISQKDQNYPELS